MLVIHSCWAFYIFILPHRSTSDDEMQSSHKAMKTIMFGNILLIQTMWKLINEQPRVLHVYFVTKCSTSRAAAKILGHPVSVWWMMVTG